MLAFELFFGRSIRGQAEVSDSAWDDFLNRMVTPNLPNGYTVFDAIGAWLNPATRRTVRERTKVLLAVCPMLPPAPPPLRESGRPMRRSSTRPWSE